MNTSESTPTMAYGDYDLVDRALAYLESTLTTRGTELSSPRVVRDYLILTAKHDNREHFRVLWLDAKYRLIATEDHATGTLTQASVYPREVVRSALEHGAAACILTHNHPSGSLEASQADLALTRHLKSALALIDVKLIDHVITFGASATSLAELGQI